MSEADNNKDKSTSTEEEKQKPETLTINVDKTTLETIRERMESKYNDFWGDVIDDEQKRTIEIADQLSPGKPYTINGKSYDYRMVGMKKWRELANMKAKADKEPDATISTDILTDYYILMLQNFFGMSQDDADMTPPGEARMICDAAVYKVMHPVPLHPEKLRPTSMQGQR